MNVDYALMESVESVRDSIFVCVCMSVTEREERESTTSVGADHPLWVSAQLFALLFG